MSAYHVLGEVPALCWSLLKCRGLWTTPKAYAQGEKEALKELWAKVANECLERTGDEGRAIREANAVVARQAEDG